jgi:hypothetical protein
MPVWYGPRLQAFHQCFFLGPFSAVTKLAFIQSRTQIWLQTRYESKKIWALAYIFSYLLEPRFWKLAVFDFMFSNCSQLKNLKKLFILAYKIKNLNFGLNFTSNFFSAGENLVSWMNHKRNTPSFLGIISAHYKYKVPRKNQGRKSK